MGCPYRRPTRSWRRCRLALVSYDGSTRRTVRAPRDGGWSARSRRARRQAGEGCDNRRVASDPRLAPDGLSGADVVVERAPDANVLAALLESEGASVRVRTSAELDADPRA